MIITSFYTNIAASFKSSYNGRVFAVLTIWHFTKWLGTPQRMQSDLANTVAYPAPAPPRDLRTAVARRTRASLRPQEC